MKTSTTARLQREHLQRHKLYSARIQRTFLVALNKQVKEASKKLPDVAAFQRAINAISPLPVEIAYKSAYRSIVLDSGQITLIEINKSIMQKRHVFDASSYHKDWLTRLREWIDTKGANRINQITENTKSKLRDVINSTYQDETITSNQERATAIYKTINDPAYNRARSITIARTETTTAANLGHTIAADTLSDKLNMAMQKTWIPTGDARTRDAHEAMFLYPPVPSEQDFLVGGEDLAFPGDPRGSARNVVNCRCRVVYQVVRDASGRILPAAN